MRIIGMMNTMHLWLFWRPRASVLSGLVLLLFYSVAAAEEEEWTYVYYLKNDTWYISQPFLKYRGWRDDVGKSYYGFRAAGRNFGLDVKYPSKTEAEAIAKRENDIKFYTLDRGLKVEEWDWRADLDKEPAPRTTPKAVGGIVIKDPERLAVPHEEVAARQMRVQREDAQRRIAARAEGIRQNAEVQAKIAAILAERAKRLPRQ